jgi:hypothetical protein
MARPRFDRRGSVPRSAIYLGALLIVAVVALLLLRRSPAPPDYTLGGGLFTLTPDQIDGVLLTRDGAQYRLDRTGSGYWTLSGALSDFLDQDGVAGLLQTLTASTGGRLLPGSEPEDRRYDFNGPGSLRLTLFSGDGEPQRLAIGTKNPVTGAYYGSGAGRSACFPVAPGLRDLLTQLPDRLRLRTLLPDFERDAVTGIEVQRDSRTDHLTRRERRWWLRLPAEGAALLGPWYRDYTAIYSDRVAEFAGSAWVLAHEQSVRLLVYESSRVVVKEMAPAADNLRLKGEFGLDEPLALIRLTGDGINPDPTAGPADELELTIGTAVTEDRVPVLRGGNVLLTEPEAVTILGEPVAGLVDDTALGFSPALADSLVLTREGTVLLRAHRDRRPTRPGERFRERPADFWLTDFLAGAPADISERARHGRSQDLLVNLERTRTLRVLPPTRSAAVLKDEERVRLTLWFPPGEPVPGVGRGKLVLEIGYLDEAALPAGSGAPVRFQEDGLPPVGLWRPDTGQLLQIPGYTITTARAWSLD